MSFGIIKVRFNFRHCKLNVIQCYAPTNEADIQDEEDWCKQLQQAPSKVPQHDVPLITRDINVKVATDNSNYKIVMGKHGCGVMSDNGECLADFCLNHNVVGGTTFPQTNIHKTTWRSPDW